MIDSVKNWKVGKVLIFALAIIFTASFFAAWDSLVIMEGVWGSREEYGYAYIIPFITAFFIWQRRYIVINEKFTTSWVGFAFVLLGIFTQFLGVLSATHSITQYGFILTIVASVWMLLGWRAFSIVAGPLMLLFLVVPLPAFLFNNLSAYLQLISSELGVWFIRLFGISVYLEGNVIDLGVYKLQVVEACSGLRYLFPLFSLSIVAAFIFKAAMWKRVVIVLSSIPITIVMNSFRIGVIGILVEFYGIDQAEGFLHDFEGWVIFMASMGILILEMWFLLKIGKDKSKLSDAFAIEEVVVPDEPYSNNETTLGMKHIIISLFIGLSIFSIGLVSEREEIIPERESFSSFPLTLDRWEGRRGMIGQDYLNALKLTDYFVADYAQESNVPVNLYLAYYEEQKSGKAAHSPKSCIPGGGWQIKDFKQININGSTVSGKPLSVNRLLIRKGEYSQLVYYWFQQRGRIITNEYLVKLYLFWDSLTKSRSDGALVRLTTTLQQGEDPELADKRLNDFILKIQPLMDQYIPR